MRDFCDRHGLLLHLDGARVCNAAVASVRLRSAEIAAPFDSVSVCLSKGLGAPVGSVLVGRSEFVTRARRARKLLGGGMRQAGILAAGGLLRAAAQHLAPRRGPPPLPARSPRASRRRPVSRSSSRAVETNMVFVDTRPSGRAPPRSRGSARRPGVLCLDEWPWTIRFVTHLDVDDDAIEAAAEAICDVMAQVR